MSAPLRRLRAPRICSPAARAWRSATFMEVSGASCSAVGVVSVICCESLPLPRSAVFRSSERDFSHTRNHIDRNRGGCVLRCSES
ncbi:hypothetical protein ACFPRL_31055 [Pseudoclavibacter helvolus]